MIITGACRSRTGPTAPATSSSPPQRSCSCTRHPTPQTPVNYGFVVLVVFVFLFLRFGYVFCLVELLGLLFCHYACICYFLFFLVYKLF